MTCNFVCDKCGNIDSVNATQLTSEGYLCAKCKDGEWHGSFPEERYNPSDYSQGPMLNRVGEGETDGPDFG